jgi:hypothetical protein
MSVRRVTLGSRRARSDAPDFGVAQAQIAQDAAFVARCESATTDLLSSSLDT